MLNITRRTALATGAALATVGVAMEAQAKPILVPYGKADEALRLPNGKYIAGHDDRLKVIDLDTGEEPVGFAGERLFIYEVDCREGWLRHYPPQAWRRDMITKHGRFAILVYPA